MLSLEFEDLSSGEKKYVGSDIELAKYIAEKLGVELQVSAMDFSAVQASSLPSAGHIAIAGFGRRTEEREKSMELSHAFNIDASRPVRKRTGAATTGGNTPKPKIFRQKDLAQERLFAV